MNFFFLLYNSIIVPAAYISFRILGFFHDKIRRGIAGRRLLFVHLQEKLNNVSKAGPAILVHAASMGEYEQARPVLRALRAANADLILVLSVFSPSAFEHIHMRHEADIITYLPFDSPWNARKFLELVSPAALVIIRHDIWPNLLREAAQRGCFTALADASVHQGSLRHRPLIRQFTRAVFALFDAIFPVSVAAAQQMRYFLSPTTAHHIFGDTRFDQVVFRARERTIAEIMPAEVLRWRRVLVAGSTWPEDEAVVIPAFARLRGEVSGNRLILVPHEPTEAHLQHAEHTCRENGLSAQRLSSFSKGAEPEVLLVDRIGLLANLYAAGQVAFVGGSFGPGVHSVIEAAAHGLPVLFGPRMRNSPEAVEMAADGCGFVVHSAEACYQKLQAWFAEPAQLQALALRARDFVERRTGASEKIAAVLLAHVSR